MPQLEDNCRVIYHKIHLSIVFVREKKAARDLIVGDLVIIRFAVQIKEARIESKFMSPTEDRRHQRMISSDTSLLRLPWYETIDIW